MRWQRRGQKLRLMAANSPHAVYESVAARTKLPLLSIVEVTAKAAAAGGCTNACCCLGIKFTMQAGFYAKVCARYGIEVVTPAEDDQDRAQSA